MKISLDLPEKAFSSLRQSPQEFSKEILISACIKWYELGRISQAKGAEITGLSRAEFIDALARYGVSAIQSEEDDLDAEVSIL